MMYPNRNSSFRNVDRSNNSESDGNFCPNQPDPYHYYRDSYYANNDQYYLNYDYYAFEDGPQVQFVRVLIDNYIAYITPEHYQLSNFEHVHNYFLNNPHLDAYNYTFDFDMSAPLPYSDYYSYYYTEMDQRKEGGPPYAEEAGLDSNMSEGLYKKRGRPKGSKNIKKCSEQESNAECVGLEKNAKPSKKLSSTNLKSTTPVSSEVSQFKNLNINEFKKSVEKVEDLLIVDGQKINDTDDLNFTKMSFISEKLGILSGVDVVDLSDFHLLNLLEFYEFYEEFADIFLLETKRDPIFYFYFKFPDYFSVVQDLLSFERNINTNKNYSCFHLIVYIFTRLLFKHRSDIYFFEGPNTLYNVINILKQDRVNDYGLNMDNVGYYLFNLLDSAFKSSLNLIKTQHDHELVDIFSDLQKHFDVDRLPPKLKTTILIFLMNNLLQTAIFKERVDYLQNLLDSTKKTKNNMIQLSKRIDFIHKSSRSEDKDPLTEITNALKTDYTSIISNANFTSIEELNLYVENVIKQSQINHNEIYARLHGFYMGQDRFYRHVNLFPHLKLLYAERLGLPAVAETEARLNNKKDLLNFDVSLGSVILNGAIEHALKYYRENGTRESLLLKQMKSKSKNYLNCEGFQSVRRVEELFGRFLYNPLNTNNTNLSVAGFARLARCKYADPAAELAALLEMFKLENEETTQNGLLGKLALALECYEKNPAVFTGKRVKIVSKTTRSIYINNMVAFLRGNEQLFDALSSLVLNYIHKYVLGYEVICRRCMMYEDDDEEEVFECESCVFFFHKINKKDNKNEKSKENFCECCRSFYLAQFGQFNVKIHEKLSFIIKNPECAFSPDPEDSLCEWCNEHALNRKKIIFSEEINLNTCGQCINSSFNFQELLRTKVMLNLLYRKEEFVRLVKTNLYQIELLELLLNIKNKEKKCVYENFDSLLATDLKDLFSCIVKKNDKTASRAIEKLQHFLTHTQLSFF